MRNILIVASGVVAVAVIAVGVYFGTRPNSPPVHVAVAATPDKAALLTLQANDHVMGDPTAPVTIIEYASLTCSHCAHFHTQILPDRKKKWIDTGMARLIYRDYPSSHGRRRSAVTS
jgi:protein-disulfide isomerase